MGISQGTWWKWENGYDEPDAKERAQIARALRVPVAALLPADVSEFAAH
jgi:transcriptional regulator with XRE-family HTH domain